VPRVFVWVPVALLAGVSGSVLIAVAAALGPSQVPALWQLGRNGLLQGMVTGLVVGVGGTMLPTLTRGIPASEARPGSAVERLLQPAAALLFFASFPLEIYGNPRLGVSLRALVAGSALVLAARLWRFPTLPGLHRRFIWIGGWLLPAGYAFAAAVPEQRSAALHVLFLGSFAVLALSVSLHVALSHGGKPEQLGGRPWQVWAMGGLLLAASALRLLPGLDPGRLRPWLACAAAAFLLATLAWAGLVVPAIRSAGKTR
jgi:uncharacterized protein involved in response to NO